MGDWDGWDDWDRITPQAYTPWISIASGVLRKQRDSQDDMGY